MGERKPGVQGEWEGNPPWKNDMSLLQTSTLLWGMWSSSPPPHFLSKFCPHSTLWWTAVFAF